MRRRWPLYFFSPPQGEAVGIKSFVFIFGSAFWHLLLREEGLYIYLYTDGGRTVWIKIQRALDFVRRTLQMWKERAARASEQTCSFTFIWIFPAEQQHPSLIKFLCPHRHLRRQFRARSKLIPGGSTSCGATKRDACAWPMECLIKSSTRFTQLLTWRSKCSMFQSRKLFHILLKRIVEIVTSCILNFWKCI